MVILNIDPDDGNRDTLRNIDSKPKFEEADFLIGIGHIY